MIEDTWALRQTDPERAVAYFYFAFSDMEKRTHGSLLRSLILQLSDQYMTAITALKGLYSRCNDGGKQPIMADLERTFLEMLSWEGHVYIVIDALDECVEQRALLPWLVGLSCPNLHLLVTSRRERDIEEYLSPAAAAQIPLLASVVDLDISAYVESQVQKDPKFKQWPMGVQEDIKEKVGKGANGMYVISLNYIQ